MRRRPLRLLVSFAGVASVTFVGYRVIHVNATTIGFAYLLVVLVIASSWGFFEASLSSVLATLVFNFFFLPPVGTFTIADPQNWVALFSFLATSLIASRLSAEAKRRALEAGRLYAFSRAILLIDRTEPFAKQLVGKLAEVFELRAAVLYERHANEFYRAGSSSLGDLDNQLRDAGLHGKVFSVTVPNRFIVGVRSGSEPIGSLALEGAQMPDSVLQGIANLVAVGLERARAADLAEQIEAARQSEQLRTTLIDAMAHEFKTPLTLIKAATTSLLASPDEPAESRTEQLTIADEEAEHLKELIDNAVEMARLDSTHIDVHREISSVQEIVHEVVGSMRTEIDKRPFDVLCDDRVPAITLDRRLIKLAIKQLVDNALKYSRPGTPVAIQVLAGDGTVTMDITDHGEGIPVEEQQRIFTRFYRSPSVKHQVPGSGLGLTITSSIMQAHNGKLTVRSRPGETTFRMILPVNAIEDEGERGSYSDRR